MKLRIASLVFSSLILLSSQGYAVEPINPNDKVFIKNTCESGVTVDHVTYYKKPMNPTDVPGEKIASQGEYTFKFPEDVATDSQGFMVRYIPDGTGGAQYSQPCYAEKGETHIIFSDKNPKDSNNKTICHLVCNSPKQN